MSNPNNAPTPGQPYAPAPQTPQYNAPLPGNGEPPLDKPYYGCSIGTAFGRFWKKYATLSGRASRSEYWWWVLSAAIISFAIWLLGFILEAAGSNFAFISNVLQGIWVLATFIPTIALSARRLHDTNKSAGWLWLSYGSGVLGGILIIIGFLTALSSGLSVNDANFFSTAVAGTGALFIIAGILLPGIIGILFFIFYVSSSKPEGARFDK